MPSYINTNVSSLNAQRQLNKSQMSQQTAMTRLSSGLRINSAKDDAAGLAIADRMTSQITGLNQASRNANDGISLAQTAEGALGEITNSLQRLRELAVQSANATNTTTDRAAIQEEAMQLTSEIQRVSGQTEFNGTKLLDGSFKAQSFQVGANAGQTISISLNSASAKTLGTGDASAITARASDSKAAGAASGAPAIAKGDVILNGVSIDASVASADTKSFSYGAGSAISKAAAFNAVSLQTGVTATVNATTAEGRAMSGSSTSGTILINGVTTTNISTTTDTAASRQSVITAINAISDRTGVKAIDSGTDAGGVQLVAADGRNISVGTSGNLTASSTGLNVNGTTVTSGNSGTDAGYQVFFGTFTLSSNKEIKIESGTGTIGNTGLQDGTYGPQTAYASAAQLASSGAITAGDFKINGVLVGNSLASYDTASSTAQAGSAISKAAAINAISKQTGVTASVNATSSSGSTMVGAAGSGSVTINGFATAAISTSTDLAATRRNVVQAINDISGKTGVKAIDTNDDTKGVKLVAADGRNIDVSFGAGVTSGSTGLAASGTVTGSVTLSSAKSFTIDTGTSATSGAGSDVKDILGLAVGTYGEGKSGQSLDSIDLSTAEGAAAALTAIDNAIKSIDSSRGSLGAVQNRFTSTISSLQTSAENLTAARSRIQDADFASETASLSRSQVLQQAGTAMLSQANASTQNVLSLLR